MTAQAHARPEARITARPGPRLPWWALVLPAVGVFALLMALAAPAQAHPSDGGRTFARIVQLPMALLS
jgi:hypothetical protein